MAAFKEELFQGWRCSTVKSNHLHTILHRLKYEGTICEQKDYLSDPHTESAPIQNVLKHSMHFIHDDHRNTAIQDAVFCPRRVPITCEATLTIQLTIHQSWGWRQALQIQQVLLQFISTLLSTHRGRQGKIWTCWVALHSCLVALEEFLSWCCTSCSNRSLLIDFLAFAECLSSIQFQLVS